LELPEIYISSSGKPYFKNSNLFFNYSHSKNYIGCAVSSYEIGIDIEETNRNINDDIAKKYLDNVIENEKRIEMWVKKESYSKLKGLGFQIKFQNVKLSEIKTKNLFIKEKEYMCSIYCDSDDVDFRELSFNGSEML
jgi:4'-phosphopantetheinyl transferase